MDTEPIVASLRAGYLDGLVLIAMPSMQDKRFSRSVVYICAHSSDGAMGLVINRLADTISFPDLLSQLGILPEGDEISLSAKEVQVHHGGPVEAGRGFVLHSTDYFRDSSTLEIDEGISLTATLDILKAMVEEQGPKQAVLALGYAGWRAGQLEAEIQENGWLVCKPDAELVFDTALEDKYDRALAMLGVDPAMLVGGAGNA